MEGEPTVVKFDVENMDDESKSAMKEYVNTNWREFADEEFTTDSTYTDTKSFNDVVKKGVHSSRMIGKDKIVIPGENATDEERSEYYTKLGRPQDETGYELNPPEDAPEGWDTSMSEGWKKFMFENNVPKNIAEKSWDYVQKLSIDGYNNQVSTYTDRIEREMSNLKKDLGTAYDDKMNLVKQVVLKFGGQETLDWVNKSNLNNESTALKLLINIGEAISDDKLLPSVRPSKGETRLELKSKLNDMMSKPGWGKKNHPDHETLMNEADRIHRQLDDYRGE